MYRACITISIEYDMDHGADCLRSFCEDGICNFGPRSVGDFITGVSSVKGIGIKECRSYGLADLPISPMI